MKPTLRKTSLGIIGILMGIYLISPTSAADATFAGPEQGPVNTESLPFTLTVDQEFAGNFHIDITGAGLNYRLTLDFDKSANTKTFTIMPPQIGLVTLVANPAGGPKIDRTRTYNVTNGINPSPSPSTSPSPTASPTPTTSSSPTASPTPTTTSGSGSGTSGNTGIGGSGTNVGSTTTVTTTITSLAEEENTVAGEIRYLQLPFTTDYDPAADLTLTFELPGGTRVDLATLYIPKGATSGPAVVSVSLPSPLERYSDGELDLEINFKLRSNGQLIEIIQQTIQLRLWTGLNTNSVLLVENFDSPIAIANLSELKLKSPMTAGVFGFQDGSASILASQLSRFVTPEMLARAKAAQARPSVTREPISRNRLIYWVKGGEPSVILDYKKRYAGSDVRLELRRYSKYKFKFIELGKLTFDSEGNGWLALDRPLRKKDHLRVILNDSVFMYHTIY